MTDRINGLTITLTHDIRVDGMEKIVNAIKMIKGVATVDMHVMGSDDLLAYNRASWAATKLLGNFCKDFKKELDKEMFNSKHT